MKLSNLKPPADKPFVSTKNLIITMNLRDTKIVGFTVVIEGKEKVFKGAPLKAWIQVEAYCKQKLKL